MEKKTLVERLNISEEKAETILSIIRGEINPEEFKSVDRWIRQCFNRPSKVELKHEAINEVLEGYGVEAVFGDSVTQPQIAYVNMGDTYTTTICFDYDKWKWIIASWGDLVEEKGL